VVGGLLPLVVPIPGLVAGIHGGVFHRGGLATLFRAFTVGATGVVSALAWLAPLL
jgi:dihydrodipicolinate synthase/N-acetylneuraminate lyase